MFELILLTVCSTFMLVLFYSAVIHPMVVWVRMRIHLNKVYRVRVPVKVTYRDFLTLIQQCKEHNLDCDQVYLNERGQTQIIIGAGNTLYNGVFSFKTKDDAMRFKLVCM